MADGMNEYEESRSSCVYASSEIQGHLERKKVLGTKTKFWCTLQNSTLCLQKKQGDPMKKIDLKNSRHVRKVTSEATGTHFEICMKKKAYVFICPTSENCTAWVKALQAAMALKDLRQYSQDSVTDPSDCGSDDNVYNVCDYDLNPAMVSANLSEYTEPHDTDDGGNTGDKDNDYWEVNDVHTKRGSSQPKPVVIDSTHSSPVEKDKKQTPQRTQSVGQRGYYAVDDQNSYTDAYSLTEVIRETQTQNSHGVNAVTQRTSLSRKDEANTCVYSDAYSVKSEVKPDTERSDIVNSMKLPEFDHNSRQFPNNDDESDLLQTLVDALPNCNSPIPEFIHPLTTEDRKPLEDLYQFLASNRDFCELSHSSVTEIDDPVASLKSYIQTMGIASQNTN